MSLIGLCFGNIVMVMLFFAVLEFVGFYLFLEWFYCENNIQVCPNMGDKNNYGQQNFKQMQK